MKNIQPQQPSHLSQYAKACLNALVEAKIAEKISIGGGLRLFHYLDYRSTHDVDAWWSEPLSDEQKNLVTQTLSANGARLSALNYLRMERQFLVFKLLRAQSDLKNQILLVGLMCH